LAIRFEDPARAPDAQSIPHDLVLAKHHVLVIPASAIRIQCTTAGYEDVVFAQELRGNVPSTLRLTADVDGAFLRQLFSEAGVTFSAVFEYDAIPENATRLVATAVVDEVFDYVLDELGDGALALDDEKTRIICHREKVREALHRSQWRQRVRLVGATETDINAVLRIFDRLDVDSFSIGKEEIDARMQAIFDWKRCLSQEGVLDIVDRFAGGEELSEDDIQTLQKAASAMSKSSKFGGGIGLKLFSLFGGVGKSENSASASEEQLHRFARNFASWLDACRQQGALAIPRELDLCLISRDRLRSDVLTEIDFHRRGDVVTVELASPFAFYRAQPPFEPAADILRSYSLQGPTGPDVD
jgi:hypothetical protein